MGLEAWVTAATDFATFSTTDLGANDAAAQYAAYEIFEHRPEKATNQAWVWYIAAYQAFEAGDLDRTTRLLQSVVDWAREIGEPRPEALALGAADQFGIARESLGNAPTNDLATEAGPQFAQSFDAAVPR